MLQIVSMSPMAGTGRQLHWVCSVGAFSPHGCYSAPVILFDPCLLTCNHHLQFHRLLRHPCPGR